MATPWILVPCLDRLRDDFNEFAPDRDRASDGTIGDAAHSSSSDHTPDEISDALRGKDADSTNEVHALDVDADLRVPGLSMETVVQHLLARCRSGAEKRLRYIIFNRRIWEASNGWRQQKYTGPNAHDKHAHFSSSYDTAREASTASWHLEDIPVALTEADKKWIRGQIDDALGDVFAGGKQPDGTPTSRIGRDVWTQGVPNGVLEGAPRDQAWEVLRDLGKQIAEIRALLAAPAKPPAS